MGSVTITHTLLRISAHFLRSTGRKRFSGYALSKELKISDDATYSTLHRMESGGWLRSEMERVNPAAISRAPRRLYQMTESGVKNAREALADLQVPQL